MRLSPALKVLPPDPYVYRGRLKRMAAGAVDWVGGRLFAAETQPIAWGKVRRVAVLRLDHMGDVLNALPALAALKKALPKARVDLYVGPWGKEIAGLGAVADRIIVADAPWFERPERVKWPLKAIWGLGRALRAGRYDLAVDLRGELRHMAALWLSGTRFRLGHSLSAGRFFLTHSFAVDNALHESQRNKGLFERAGLRLGEAKAALKPQPKARQEAARAIKGLKLPKRFIAIQAACGTPAKRWMPERWAQVIDALPLPAVLLGSASEALEMRSIALRCKREPKVAAGMLSLPGLAAFLQKAELLISVDSGPAHIAGNLGRPVVALYSATNLASQWAPLALRQAQGRVQVRVIQKQVPCGPCELTVCPYENECMRRISVGEVRRAAKAALR